MDKVILTAVRTAFIGVFSTCSVALAQTNILVVRPAGPTFEEAEKGISETLGDSWVLKEFTTEKDASAKSLAQEWKTLAPKAVVLMDNRSVSLYKEARTILGDTVTPVVALMGVRIDLAIHGLANAVGINYEIPAVTSVVNLRSVAEGEMKRVGVVYRKSWQDFFTRQSEFCQPESIQLVGRAIDDDGNVASDLKKALNDLVKEEKVDALWILNDNLFLNPKIIQGVWMPAVKKSKVLSVVGVEPLVNPSLDFGSFAVLPDHYALGSQAAGLLQEMQDMDWVVEDPRADQPLSVVKILNAKQVRKRGGVRAEKLGEIDKVLE